MSDKLVTIAEYMDSMSAEMALQVLADYGIKGILSGRYRTDALAGVPAFSTVKLQVMESQADQARQLLEEQEDAHEPEDYEVMSADDGETSPDGRDDSDDDEPYEPEEEENN
jgi:hypothetical protein